MVHGEAPCNSGCASASARPSVPESNRSVVTARSQESLEIKGHPGDGPCVARQGQQLLAGSQVPQSDLPVAASGNQALAVGTEGDAVELSCLRDTEFFRPLLRIPHFDGEIRR